MYRLTMATLIFLASCQYVGNKKSSDSPKKFEDQYSENIRAMHSGKGYDFVIVVTSTPNQADYWQKRLDQTKNMIGHKNSQVISVYEDWDGGAGNGLGTLYAFTKANKKLKDSSGKDLNQYLQDGKSIAMFHTAGKGTRLAPLPGSEVNNKPGVKLPGIVKIGEKDTTISILEAVIKQTGPYATSRGGRLSVFWGDQVFIPGKSFNYKADSHVDILAKLGQWPDKAEWEEKKLSNYGLVAVAKEGSALVEKVSFDQAKSYLQHLGSLEQVGTSLGSFSVSKNMLDVLLDEFKTELESKKGKLDTDPDFWMPLTLPKKAYTEIMASKNVAANVAQSQWERMNAMAKKLKPAPLFKAVDVGENPYWWDYGQISGYYTNNMKILGEDREAKAMREFFYSGSDVLKSGNIVLSSETGSQKVRNSIVINCKIKDLEATNSILINVVADKVSAEDSLVYKTVSESTEEIKLKGDVMTTIFDSQLDSISIVNSLEQLAKDGRDAWEKVYPTNSKSFDQIYLDNLGVDIRVVEDHWTDQRFAD